MDDDDECLDEMLDAVVDGLKCFGFEEPLAGNEEEAKNDCEFFRGKLDEFLRVEEEEDEVVVEVR